MSADDPAVPPVLAGVRVIECNARGPAPFGVMLLADLGADVIRVDRPGQPAEESGLAGIGRGRRAIALDLKTQRGVQLLLELIDGADVLVEAHRPGVAERLGFGPEPCLARNPRLIYARMTGWGQEGPLADCAAHDINYLAIAGALYPIGAADRPPPPPLTLIADFGAGATYLVIGVLAALLERSRSGRGQVVDAAMVDGIASMLTSFHGMRASGAWSDRRESNLVDGGAPWYRTYETADGKYVAVGALGPGFYRALIDRLGLDSVDWPQYEVARWPQQREQLARLFATQPRAHWEAVFAGSNACVTPVLTLSESIRAPQLAARGVFDDDGMPQPAPRLSRTPLRADGPPPASGEDTDEILDELGIAAATRDELRRSGVVA